MNVELITVIESTKHVLANLVQFYRYDFSGIRGYELTPHGTFVYRYLDHYFAQEDSREACFITTGGRLAGFTRITRPPNSSTTSATRWRFTAWRAARS
jgi:predicted acetyltransferase